jgi:hypothetical protein
VQEIIILTSTHRTVISIKHHARGICSLMTGEEDYGLGALEGGNIVVFPRNVLLMMNTTL